SHHATSHTEGNIRTSQSFLFNQIQPNTTPIEASKRQIKCNSLCHLLEQEQIKQEIDYNSLEDSYTAVGIIPLLCTISEKASHLPLRGTALFALSLISSSLNSHPAMHAALSRQSHDEWVNTYIDDYESKQKKKDKEERNQRVINELRRTILGKDIYYEEQNNKHLQNTKRRNNDNMDIFIKRLPQNITDWDFPSRFGFGVSFPSTFKKILTVGDKKKELLQEQYIEIDKEIIDQKWQDSIYPILQLQQPGMRDISIKTLNRLSADNSIIIMDIRILPVFIAQILPHFASGFSMSDIHRIQIVETREQDTRRSNAYEIKHQQQAEPVKMRRLSEELVTTPNDIKRSYRKK
ncbi:MAG: hypothetical protein EZS28_042993, partial [Streblomastix strix]